MIIGFSTLAIAITLYQLHYPQRLLTILMYCIICAVFYIVLTYHIGLEKWEKRHVMEFAGRKLQKV